MEHNLINLLTIGYALLRNLLILCIMGFLTGLVGAISSIAPSVGSAMGGPLGELIGKGVSSLGTNIVSDQAQQQSFNNSTKMLELQNKFNVDMFNRTNAYNTPGAQKERLLEAGLNPLFYMGGGVTSNATMPSSASQQQSAVSDATQRMQAQIELNAQLQRLSNETKVADSEVNLNNQNAKVAQATADKTREETVGQKILNEWNRETYNTRVDEVTQRVNNLRKDINIKDVDIKSKKLQNKFLALQIHWLPRMNQAQLQQYSATSYQLIKHAELLMQQRQSEYQQTQIAKQLKEIAYRSGINPNMSPIQSLIALLSDSKTASQLGVNGYESLKSFFKELAGELADDIMPTEQDYNRMTPLGKKLFKHLAPSTPTARPKGSY